MTPPPTVVAVVRGRTAVVRCPFCQRRHVHGANSYGLRTAHCADGVTRAYVLMPAAS